VPSRYFEDFTPGETLYLGSVSVSEAEIIAFARQFDPQPFHVDRELAARSTFGGIIASGWHTSALFTLLLNNTVFPDSSSMGSPGVERLRWLKPVRPGDTLSGRLIVLEATPSRSKPDRGVLRNRGEMFNQHGELVLDLEAVMIFGRRPVAAE
jgi:acyl dehydratase